MSSLDSGPFDSHYLLGGTHDRKDVTPVPAEAIRPGIEIVSSGEVSSGTGTYVNPVRYADTVGLHTASSLAARRLERNAERKRGLVMYAAIGVAAVGLAFGYVYGLDVLQRPSGKPNLSKINSPSFAVPTAEEGARPYLAHGETESQIVAEAYPDVTPYADKYRKLVNMINRQLPPNQQLNRNVLPGTTVMLTHDAQIPKDNSVAPGGG